ncbi:MAG: aminoacyl-tRNA hydrolase [Cytophagales bacterium]|nr:aminoacyl-tRNA hydrolase [Cytophagales bacterium]
MKFLIAGLGNVGPEYELTRHNVGFMAVDHLAQQCTLTFSLDRHAYVTEYKYKGKNITLIKPTTYMNLSGKAVAYWMHSLNIPIQNILIITDDLNLPFGTIRLRAQGSSGGQNGLNHINEVLNSQNYARLRIGIGSNFHKGRQSDYVLSRFTQDEFANLEPLLQKSGEAILSFCTEGINVAMNKYNTK